MITLKILNIVKCSRNFEFDKQTDQKLYHTKSPSWKGIFNFEEKELKQCQKEVIYEYILAIAGWWSIFWVVVGGSGYILADGGW